MTGKLTANFTIPNVFLVFQFEVNGNRLVHTSPSVSTNTQVSLHPLKHNMYEGSVMGGVVVYSIVLLHFFVFQI